MGDQKVKSLSRCNKRTELHRPENHQVFMHRRLGPDMEIWKTSRRSITIVPCLHQSNLDIKT